MENMNQKIRTNLRLTVKNRDFLDWLKSEEGRQKEHVVNAALDALRKKYERLKK